LRQKKINHVYTYPQQSLSESTTNHEVLGNPYDFIAQQIISLSAKLYFVVMMF